MNPDKGLGKIKRNSLFGIPVTLSANTAYIFI
jgi:hypothetical protein